MDRKSLHHTMFPPKQYTDFFVKVFTFGSEEAMGERSMLGEPPAIINQQCDFPG